MAVPEPLLVFVKEALARGTPRTEIEAVLHQAGWEKEQVTAALRSYAEVSFAIPVPRPSVMCANGSMPRSPAATSTTIRPLRHTS